MIRYGKPLLRLKRLLRHSEHLFKAAADPVYPALIKAGVYPAAVNLGKYADGVCYVGRLGLGSAHAAKAAGYEQTPVQIVLFVYAKELPARAEYGVERAVYYALRPYVHPAARGHLAVVGNAHLLRNLPILRIIEHAYHERVGNYHPWRFWARREQAQRVPRLHNKGLIFGKLLKIFLYQPVLQPVLAYGAGLAVCYKLVWIKRYLKIKVVIHHHLKGLALDAVALVLIYGLAVYAPLRAESICIYAAAGNKLLHKFARKLFMQLLRNIAQRVPQRRLSLRLCQSEAPVRRAPYTLDKPRVFGQNSVKLYRHCLCRVHVAHVFFLPVILYFILSVSFC